MYSPGKVIYFDPFLFKDGSSKRKYFLVLKVIQNSAVVASLPSSVNHLPTSQAIEHGCLELPDSEINCYVFEANRSVTKDGWSFDLHTFLYGWWLNDFDLELLNSQYQIEHVDYEIVGDLTDDELQKVIDCFANSSVVKRKYKRLLSGG